MYKKALGFLILIQAIFLAGYLCVLGSNLNQRRGIKSVYEIRLNQIVLANEQSSGLEILKDTSSRQRIVTYNVLEKFIEPEQETLCTGAGIVMTPEDYENLLRIVEAEAGGEDDIGKLLVANVVFNRVKDESFPDTVTEVIFQQSKGVTQFSPVASGRIWKVEVSKETVEAVNRAIEGEDVSQGALYFAARKHANQKSMRWFDECLEYLFTHGGHEFFKE